MVIPRGMRGFFVFFDNQHVFACVESRDLTGGETRGGENLTVVYWRFFSKHRNLQRPVLLSVSSAPIYNCPLVGILRNFEGLSRK